MQTLIRNSVLGRETQKSETHFLVMITGCMGLHFMRLNPINVLFINSIEPLEQMRTKENRP